MARRAYRFTGMREHYLEAFDVVRIDNLHGNRIISEYAPDGSRTSETSLRNEVNRQALRSAQVSRYYQRYPLPVHRRG